MDKIDFVLLWVDGNDSAWLEQKNQYSPKKVDFSTSDNRFRDWDNLQYWFRGVEKYAPWVNNIYFITWGHLPKWLNTEHPKLKIVKHTDFIPEQYLPTFNSDTIETNLFRLDELSETFVLFNDDFFLIDSVKPEDFFHNGLPCDSFVENLIAPVAELVLHTRRSLLQTSLMIILRKEKCIRESEGKSTIQNTGCKILLPCTFLRSAILRALEIRILPSLI